MKYLALFILCVLCISCGVSTSPNLWEKAQIAGENKIFTIVIDGKQYSAVRVSATGHPEEIAIQNAYQKARKILGNNIRKIDLRITHQSKHNTCIAEVLMATQ